MRDRSGSLWIGTQGHGVMRVRGLSADPVKVTTGLSQPKSWAPTDQIRSLIRGSGRHHLDRDAPGPHSTLRPEHSNRTGPGGAWCSCPGRHCDAGWKRLDGNRQTVFTAALRVAVRPTATEQGLPGRTVTAWHEDATGTLWAATTQGLARFSGNRFLPVRASGGVALQNVRSMTGSRDGALWVCDLDGLFRWRDGQSQSRRHGAAGNVALRVFH